MNKAMVIARALVIGIDILAGGIPMMVFGALVIALYMGGN